MTTSIKRNILFYHDSGLHYGSTEKLLQSIAKNLNSEEFNVYFFYSDQKHGEPQLYYFIDSDVNLIKFKYDQKMESDPYTVYGMKPNLIEIINDHKIECVFLVVYWDYYQFPVNIIPSTIPIISVSPFGHWCTNGNVYKTYCSGFDNLMKVKSKGGLNSEVFYNPLPETSKRYLKKKINPKKIIFGRVGRNDDEIFDPISIYAFKKLEDKYGNKVSYNIVNPPPKMIQLAKKLKIININYLYMLTEEQLREFYYEIDVFAHARKDGETLGVAIGEAMIAGNPIISHKSHYHNNHINLLDEKYSKWTEPDDIENYYKHMIWFVENSNKIIDMGLLARNKATEIFGNDSIMNKISNDLTAACQFCTYWRKYGKIKGNILLFLVNIINININYIKKTKVSKLIINIFKN